MSELKTWIICVTVVCFAGIMIRHVLPSGKITDTVITVFRLSVLSITILPLFNLNPADLIPDDINDILQTDAADYGTELNFNVLLIQSEEVLHNEIGRIVELYYDGHYEICSDMDITDDNSIHIKQVQVVISERSERQDEMVNALISFCPVCEVVTAQEVKQNDE